MGKILNVLWRLWFVVLAFTLILLFVVPILLLSINPAHFRYVYFLMRLFCIITFYGMGFRYDLIKKTTEQLDKNRQYIFIANHTSSMDILLMCILHSEHPLCFIGKAELAKIPVFGMIYRRIAILVDRRDPKSRAGVYRQAARKMNSGQSLVIFPEGGVPEERILLDKFKDGAFTLSTKHFFPVVVYTFVGLGEKFPFDMTKGHPGKVTVVLNKIMEPTTLKEMKHKAHCEILSTLEQYQGFATAR